MSSTMRGFKSRTSPVVSFSSLSEVDDMAEVAVIRRQTSMSVVVMEIIRVIGVLTESDE